MKNQVRLNLIVLFIILLGCCLGLNQAGHFNTENVTKLTKVKQPSTPVEEPEVCLCKSFFIPN